MSVASSRWLRIPQAASGTFSFVPFLPALCSHMSKYQESFISSPLCFGTIHFLSEVLEGSQETWKRGQPQLCPSLPLDPHNEHHPPRHPCCRRRDVHRHSPPFHMCSLGCIYGLQSCYKPPPFLLLLKNHLTRTWGSGEFSSSPQF